jgi:4-cresol dehydrogenase (hydroxylating)
VPTSQPLKSVLWPVGDDLPAGTPNPDEGHSGMLYCLPFLPLRGAEARTAVDRADEIARRHQFVAYITLNVVDSRALEAVINVAFDRRDPGRVSAAHQCIDEMNREFLGRGYTLYRVGIQSMSQVVSEQDLFWRLVRDLKSVFDPNHIIAPGRYNLV